MNETQKTENIPAIAPIQSEEMTKALAEADEYIPYKKYGISKTLYLRYLKFVREYIKNGFNGTQAYMKVYRCKNNETARADAPLVLAYSSVHLILCDELKKTELGITPEWIKTQVIELMKSAKLEATKSRMLELLGKIEGLYSDNKQQIAVFSTQDEDSVIRKRLQANTIEQ